MHTRRHTILTAFAALLLLAAAPPTPTTADDLAGELTIILEGALAQNYRGGAARGHPLSLHLTREAGQWTEAWGKASTHNTALHEVDIVESNVSARTIELTVEVAVGSDLWISGGQARFDLKVERLPADDGLVISPHPVLRTGAAIERFRGHHQGVFEGRHASFEAAGQVKGLRWAQRPIHAERRLRDTLVRPRLLMRPEDVTRVRERLDTPLGRAALQRLHQSDTAIGHALLYVLTDDPAHAERAAEHAEDEMTRPGHHTTHQSTWWADRAQVLAFALDLCADAWPSDFRTRIENWIEPVNHSGLYNQHQWGSGAVITPGQFLSDKMYGGCGLAAMALWGRPGDPPTPPATSGSIHALQERFGAADGLSLEQRLERYRRQLARWREVGGANRKYLDDAYYARRMIFTGTQRGIGEGGSGGHPYLWDFALAWRSMFGRDLTSRPTLSHAGVRPLLATIWVPDAETDRLQPRLPFGGRPLTGGELARLVALADDRYQPALMGYWLNLAGIEPAALNTDAGAMRLLQTIAPGDPLAIAYVLLHLPESPQATAPDRRLPRVWLEHTPGTLWARSGFDGTDSIVARFTARQMGRNNPYRQLGAELGHFRIYGFGHHWAAHDGTHFNAHERFNAVHLTDMHTNGWANGRVLDYREMPDLPAASLTADISARYHRLERRTTTRTVTQTRGNLTVDRPVTRVYNAIEDVGIEAIRAFAADYSGECGAPALFVIVDRISGEQGKQWTMHVPDLADTPVEIDGNRFTIRKGDATLTATFIAPADVRIDKRLGYSTKVFRVIGRDHGTGFYRRDVLTATGKDSAAGNFFVVMTLQRGQAPPVHVEGQGLDATVTVGRRAIRFDDGRIVFEP